MKNSILIVSAIVFIALLSTATGCKPDKNQVTPTVDSGKLYFHLHTNIDTNEVEEYDIPYTTSQGRKISLSKAQLYISNIQLVKTDGTLYSIPGVVVLKKLDPEEYFIANVPVGTYKSVKFAIGLDATTNAQANTSITELNDADMWLDATAQPNGFVFVNVQGKIDTTTQATGTESEMQPFTLKIATNEHYTAVSMPDHTPVYAMVKDQATFVHMVIDYSKLFDNIQLNNSANLTISTASDNNTANANAVSNNIAGMFSYEE